MTQTYDHADRDEFWQQKWQQGGCFRWDSEAPGQKYYVLEMFPYTSGRMHIGHARNYSMGDSLARMQRARGFNVLYPMGWDAFGLPAENAAKKFGTHPATFTSEAIAKMKYAMGRLGLSYSWENEITTCNAEYIRAQQMLFLEIFARGLVYRKESYVYWDPVEATVLANEQVVDGKGWRSGAPVIKKRVAQWFCNIRAYAEELLEGLDQLEGWPQSVKNIQRSWIGKSEGVLVDFAVTDSERSISVFTTRADTLAGCTFLVVAPEHEALDSLAMSEENRRTVIAFRDQVLMQSAEERSTADKAGVLTGLQAVNPLTGAAVPIVVGNYVTIDFGTGAVMGVPAHDQRDWDFAKVFGFASPQVVTAADGMVPDANSAFEDDGIVRNSGPELDGLASGEARAKVASLLANKGQGSHSVQYRLQDWSISRQRYWGCPIPIVHCVKCGAVPAAAESLPIMLPDRIALEGSGSPLSRDSQWMSVSCPRCGNSAQRDPDTMDTFVDSSWYFLRYPAPHATVPVDKAAAERACPVDVYIGGVEHAILHLIYSRFMTKVLRDLGYVSFDEPFLRLYNQGMVNDAEGKKQSKSAGNATEPMDVIERFGADALRLYLLFKTSYNAPINWDDNGPKSARHYLDRVGRLVARHEAILKDESLALYASLKDATDAGSLALVRAANYATHKVTVDIEKFSFNTAIASVMTLTNQLYAAEQVAAPAVLAGTVRVLLRLLAPFAPHICEQMWAESGQESMLVSAPWPEVDSIALMTETVVLAIQVNGKLVTTMEAPVDVSEDDLVAQVLEHVDVRSRLEGKELKGRRFVPRRVLNLVVS